MGGVAGFLRKRVAAEDLGGDDDDTINAHFIKVLSDPQKRGKAVSYLKGLEPSLADVPDDEFVADTIAASAPKKAKDPAQRQVRQDALSLKAGLESYQQVVKDRALIEHAKPENVTAEDKRRAAAADEDPSIGSARMDAPAGIPTVENEAELMDLERKAGNGAHRFIPKFSQQEMLLDKAGQPLAIMQPGATQSLEGFNLANATGQNSYVQKLLANAGYAVANVVAGKDIGEGKTLGQRGLRELGGDIGKTLAERPVDPRDKLFDVRKDEARGMEFLASNKAKWDDLQAKGWNAGAEAMASSEPGAVTTGVIGSTLGNVMGGKAKWDEIQRDWWKRQAEISKPAEEDGPSWLHEFNADMAKDNEEEAKGYRGIQTRMESPSGAADVMRYWGSENDKDAADYRLMAQHAADTQGDIEAAQRGEFSPERVQDMKRASFTLGGQEVGELASAIAPTDVSIPGGVNKVLKWAAPNAHAVAKAGAEVLGEALPAGRVVGGLLADAPGGGLISDVSHIGGTKPVAKGHLLAANDANKGTSQLAANMITEEGNALLDDAFSKMTVDDTRWWKRAGNGAVPQRALNEAEKKAANRKAFEVWHDAAARREAPQQVQEVIRALQPLHEKIFRQAQEAGNIPARVQYNPLHLDYGQNFSMRAKMDVSNASREAVAAGETPFLAKPLDLRDPQLAMTPGLEKYHQGEIGPYPKPNVDPANTRGIEQIISDRKNRLEGMDDWGVMNRMEARAWEREMRGHDALSGMARGARLATQDNRAGSRAAAASLQKDLPAMREEANREIRSFFQTQKDNSKKQVIAAPDYEPLNSHYSDDEIWGGAIKNARGIESEAARAEGMAKSYVDDNALKVMRDEANALDKEFNAARTHADRLRLAENAEGLKRVALDKTEARAGKRLQAQAGRAERAADAQVGAESKLHNAGEDADAPLEMNAWLKSSKADEARAALAQERTAATTAIQDTYAEAEAKAEAARERATAARTRYDEAANTRKSVLGQSQERLEKADMEAREIFAKNRSKGIISRPVMEDLTRTDSVLVRVKGSAGPIDADLGKRVLEVPQELAFLDGYKLPRHDAEAMLQTVMPVSKRASTHAKKVTHAVNEGLGLGQMKRLITQGNMGFEARNIVGNLMRVASNDPDAITDKWLRNMVARISNASFDSKTAVTIGDQTFTLGELKQMMVRDAGVGTGSVDRLLGQEGVTPGVGNAGEWALSRPGAVLERAGGGAAKMGKWGKTAAPEAANWLSRAAVAPGAAVNAGADSFARTIFSHGGLEKLNKGFNTDDGLRMLAVLGGVKRGMSPQVAIRQMKHLLIDYSTSSAAKEVAGNFIPFIKYYTGAFQGAAHLAIKHPRRYARFADAMRMVENLDRSVNGGKTIDPRLKPVLDRASFNPTVTTDGGEPMQVRVEHHGGEIANMLGMVAGTENLQGFMPEELRDLDDGRGFMGSLHPLIGNIEASLTGADASTGRSIYGMSPDEMKSWDSGAYDQWVGAYKEQTDKGINNLGKYPELNALYSAAKYTPYFGGRFLPAQADLVARTFGGMGSSPASRSQDGQASALQRGLLSAMLGIRSTAKNRQTQFKTAQKKRAESIPPPLNIIGAKKR